MRPVKNMPGKVTGFETRPVPWGARGNLIEFDLSEPYPSNGWVLGQAATQTSFVRSVEQIHGRGLKNEKLVPIGAEVVAWADKGKLYIQFYNGGAEVVNGWVPAAGAKLILRVNGD